MVVEEDPPPPLPPTVVGAKQPPPTEEVVTLPSPLLKASSNSVKQPNQCQASVLTGLTTLQATPLSFVEALKGKVAGNNSISAQLAHVEFATVDLPNRVVIEGKPTVFFDAAEHSSLVSQFEYALIGKFSHGKPSWNKVVEFFNLLKLKHPCKVSIYDHKHIYIVCSHKDDFYRIWLRLVWSIDGYNMRVFRWEPHFSVMKESPIAPVWIRFEKLPLHMFDKMPLLAIANAVGKPICIDPRNLNGAMLNSARVCVELDVSKPLVDIIKVVFQHKDSQVIVEEFTAHVFYDTVPSFCHYCLHLGHHQDVCKRKVISLNQQEVSMDTDELKTGPISSAMASTSRNKEQSQDRAVKKVDQPVVATKRPAKEHTLWQPVVRKKKVVASTSALSMQPTVEREITGTSARKLVAETTAVVNRFASLEGDAQDQPLHSSDNEFKSSDSTGPAPYQSAADIVEGEPQSAISDRAIVVLEGPSSNVAIPSNEAMRIDGLAWKPASVTEEGMQNAPPSLPPNPPSWAEQVEMADLRDRRIKRDAALDNNGQDTNTRDEVNQQQIIPYIAPVQQTQQPIHTPKEHVGVSQGLKQPEFVVDKQIRETQDVAKVRYIDFEKIDVFDDIIALTKPRSVPSSPRLSRRGHDLDELALIHSKDQWVDDYTDDWEPDDMEMETTLNFHKRYNLRPRNSSRKGFKFRR